MEARDRTSATNIVRAAERAGVRRIVYLGGPVPQGELAPHLRSRAEVGRILLSSPVPAVVLRAAVIIGSGSASFEMLRYLTERLPAMVTPRWVRNRVQPIAVRDVLRYLAAAATLPPEVDRAFDIGGPEVITYEEMMQRYARVAGLRPRLIVPVPGAHAGAVVALGEPRDAGPRRDRSPPHRVAHPRGRGGRARHRRVDPRPTGGPHRRGPRHRAGVAKDLPGRRRDAWSSAAWPGAPSDPLPTDPDWSGGSIYVDERERHVATTAPRLWDVVEGIGGEHGWYSFPLAWSVRGLADRLVGGVGLRRGRRDARRLRVGEALDFWRVEEVTPGALLRLRAEMRLPGRAWLELRVVPDLTGRAPRLVQRRRVPPAGARRPRLLVVGGAVPRDRVRLDGPQHRLGGRTSGRRLLSPL